MISKPRFHNLLEINLLQNTLFGRLAVAGTLTPEGRPWVRPDLAQARQAKGVIRIAGLQVHIGVLTAVLTK